MTAFSGGGSFKNLILSGFRPIEKFKKLFNPAFTLAEVLITLGIIGVVAAMTIPTLMTKVKEKQTVTKVKKAYSNLANAYRLMGNDDDYPLAQCLSSSGFNSLADYANTCIVPMSKYLKVANISYPGNLNPTAFPPEGWPNLLGYFEESVIIQTMDGMIFYFPCSVLEYGIYVDVNGLQGPNVGGKDLFCFEYGNTWKNDKQQLIYNLQPRSGTCTKTSYGTWCTAQVLETGRMDYLK
jgi:prepilin-type N-terminal cleavage/methylation domain-containing protein